KFQGIDRILGELGALELAVVEQQLQPPLPADAKMMAAVRVRTDPQVGLELAMEDHLLALRTFFPEIVGRTRLAGQRLELGTDEVREPVHGVRVPSGASCAAYTRGQLPNESKYLFRDAVLRPGRRPVGNTRHQGRADHGG